MISYSYLVSPCISPDFETIPFVSFLGVEPLLSLGGKVLVEGTSAENLKHSSTQ